MRRSIHASRLSDGDGPLFLNLLLRLVPGQRTYCGAGNGGDIAVTDIIADRATDQAANDRAGDASLVSGFERLLNLNFGAIAGHDWWRAVLVEHRVAGETRRCGRYGNSENGTDQCRLVHVSSLCSGAAANEVCEYRSQTLG